MLCNNMFLIAKSLRCRYVCLSPVWSALVADGKFEFAPAVTSTRAAATLVQFGGQHLVQLNDVAFESQSRTGHVQPPTPWRWPRSPRRPLHPSARRGWRTIP